MNIATINGARLGYWESGRTPIGAMRRGISMKKFAFLLLFTAVVTSAQMPASRELKSDAEKIASAVQAGPKFVTQNATVIDYPTSPSGEFRVLRAGTNGWTCLPGFRGAPMMSPAALTRSSCNSSKTVLPVVRPMCRVSEFHICMVANLYLTSRTRWEAAMNSTLGHTS